MKYKWITWIILAALLTISGLRSQRVPGSLTDRDAPSFSGTLLDGDRFDLNEHKGQVVVLDFWATWCNPCLKSLPALNAVAQAYADDPKVWVGSVNKERISKRGLQRFLNELNLTFPVIRDRGKISRSYQVNALPTLIIINPRGEIMTHQIGLYSSDTSTLTRHLKGLIEEARRQTE